MKLQMFDVLTTTQLKPTKYIPYRVAVFYKGVRRVLSCVKLPEDKRMIISFRGKQFQTGYENEEVFTENLHLQAALCVRSFLVHVDEMSANQRLIAASKTNDGYIFLVGVPQIVYLKSLPEKSDTTYSW